MNKREANKIAGLILLADGFRRVLPKLDRERDANVFDKKKCLAIEKNIRAAEVALRNLSQLIRKYGLKLYRGPNERKT